MRQVRAVSLSGYAELAASLGLDPVRMLKDAGIPAQALEDPENRLSATAAVKLLEDSAELSRCDTFGLRLVETRTLGSLGPLSLLLERLPNALEIVRTAIEFQRSMNDIVSISLDELGDYFVIRLELLPSHWGVQMSDLIIGYAYEVLAEATGRWWRPSTVHVVRRPPTDVAIWRQVFAVPIEFTSDFNGFLCTREAMLAPNPNADLTMAANARRLLGLARVNAPPSSLTERVRQTIAAQLPTGRVTIDTVAAQLATSRRSLQRGLFAEGHSFGALLDETRRNLATAYLADSSHPVTSVSALLGYHSPSAFTRWFGGTFGISPQMWRRESLGQFASAGAASGKNGIETSNGRPSPSRNV